MNMTLNSTALTVMTLTVMALSVAALTVTTLTGHGTDRAWKKQDNPDIDEQGCLYS